MKFHTFKKIFITGIIIVVIIEELISGFYLDEFIGYDENQNPTQYTKEYIIQGQKVIKTIKNRDVVPIVFINSSGTTLSPKTYVGLGILAFVFIPLLISFAAFKLYDYVEDKCSGTNMDMNMGQFIGFISEKYKS